MSIWSSIFLLTVLVYVYLGGYVFTRKPRTLLNSAFMVYCLVGAVMGFTDFMCTHIIEIKYVIPWVRLRQLWPLSVVFLLVTVFAFVDKAGNDQRIVQFVRTARLRPGFLFHLLNRVRVEASHVGRRLRVPVPPLLHRECAPFFGRAEHRKKMGQSNFP